MKIIVDTCIWSLAFRRGENKNDPHVNELSRLIDEVRIQMIGPIRQELLSGIKSKKQFETLKKHISAFPDLSINTSDYEKAAEFFNKCKVKGIQGSNTDFLICAISYNTAMPIFTLDKDFKHFQRYLPIKLHEIRDQS